MAAGHMRDDEAEALRTEIRNALPYGSDWLVTPHQLLGGTRRKIEFWPVTWKASETCFIPSFTLALREHPSMQQFGSDRNARHVVSRGRSEILGDRVVNASHCDYAEPILASPHVGASVRNPLFGRESHGRSV